MTSKKFEITGVAKTEGVVSAINNVGSASRKAKKAVGDLGDSSSKTSKSMDDAGKASEAMGQRFAKVQGAAALTVAAVVGVAYAFDQVSQKSIQFQAASQNLPFSIGKATQATMGLVDSLQLMHSAIAADRLNVAHTDEDFARLTAAATKLGLSIGQDATKSVEDLTTALARGSTPILDNLGIILKVGEAHEIYARRLGKTVNQLSDVEKQQAFVTIGLERAEEAASKVNLQLDEGAVRFQQWKTDLVDFGNVAATEFTNGIAVASDMTEVWLGYMTGLNAEFHELAALSGNAGGFKNASKNVIGEMNDSIAQKLLSQSDRINEDAANLLFMINTQEREGEAAAKRKRSRTKGVGGRADPYKDERAAFNDQLSEAKGGAVKASAIQGLQRGNSAVDPFSPEAMKQESAARKAHNDEIAELDLARNERLFEDKLRSVELQRELGIDPISAINAETEARLEYNEFLQSNTDNIIDKERLLGERRQIEHDAELARIQAQQAAQQKRLQTIVSTTASMVGITSNAAGIMAAIGDAAIKDDQRRAKMKQAVMSIEAFGIGALETVKAAKAIASYNYVEAGLHISAAALAFTQGALLASGNAGAGGGSGGVSTAGSATQFAGGDRAQANSGERNDGGPISLPSERRQSAPTTPNTAANRNQGGNVVNIGTLNATGNIDEETAIRIGHSIADADRNVGRRSSGT